MHASNVDNVYGTAVKNNLSHDYCSNNNNTAMPTKKKAAKKEDVASGVGDDENRHQLCLCAVSLLGTSSPLLARIRLARFCIDRTNIET